jgi:hypothetical protein
MTTNEMVRDLESHVNKETTLNCFLFDLLFVKNTMPLQREPTFQVTDDDNDDEMGVELRTGKACP